MSAMVEGDKRVALLQSGLQLWGPKLEPLRWA